MWLLNTTTMTLEEFWDSSTTPRYAILSHTWEKQEASFEAIANLESAARLDGYPKVKACCRQARIDGYEWAWIDTCCIDKSSSSELSEAINSMFRYYKESAICYAYLADVSFDESPDAIRISMRASRWFTRGWTLQEMIAPSEVVFFSNDWKKVGLRSELCYDLSLITGIDEGVLSGQEPVKQRSIAQRMSWASLRTTTRVEDMAYSLLGIFDVNMPLLYGEGCKAFIRLQEEIMKHSNDQTLFAWTTHGGHVESSFGGFLASSPSDFRECDDLIPLHSPFVLGSERPYSMTNMGLCIDLPVFERPRFTSGGFVALLACTRKDDTFGDTRLGLSLKLTNLDLIRTKTRAALLAEDDFGNPILEKASQFQDFLVSSPGVRDGYRRPISFKVADVGSFNFPFVEIYWDSTTVIKAHLFRLYLPQDPSTLV